MLTNIGKLKVAKFLYDSFVTLEFEVDGELKQTKNFNKHLEDGRVKIVYSTADKSIGKMRNIKFIDKQGEVIYFSRNNYDISGDGISLILEYEVEEVSRG